MSDITYEELTRVSWIAILSCSMSRTLPMRNWHFGDNGINFHSPVLATSDITYEELTPLNAWFNSSSSLLHVGHYLWVIDTHSFHGSSVITLWSELSDITYEELTHFHLTYPAVLDIFRRTLPMRNWHVFLSRYPMPCPDTSRTLPMRNWHCSDILHNIRDRFCLLVGHYLWGIDTIYNTWEHIHWCIVSRTLPMRNWHQKHKEKSLHILLLLVGHYLWGIDTDSVIHPWTGQESDITYEELTPKHFQL